MATVITQLLNRWNLISTAFVILKEATIALLRYAKTPQYVALYERVQEVDFVDMSGEEKFKEVMKYAQQDIELFGRQIVVAAIELTVRQIHLGLEDSAQSVDEPQTSD